MRQDDEDDKMNEVVDVDMWINRALMKNSNLRSIFIDVMKNLLIVNMLLLTFSCASSKPVLEEPSVKNPTFYVFSKSKQEVEKAIVEALGGYESSKRRKFYRYFLVQHPNGKIKLKPDEGNLSKVYFRKNGEAYLYCPDIQIVIDSITENTTKVIINVIDPEVRTRLTILPAFPHGRAWKYKAVPATTVEEYEILLMIGKELYEGNMPELKIPERVVF